MLSGLDDINSVPEDMLCQGEDAQSRSISHPVLRVDGKQDRWAPRYLCNSQPLTTYANYTTNLDIKLSDMGGGEYSDVSLSY